MSSSDKDQVDWNDRCGLAVVVIATVILVIVLGASVAALINAWARQ